MWWVRFVSVGVEEGKKQNSKLQLSVLAHIPQSDITGPCFSNFDFFFSDHHANVFKLSGFRLWAFISGVWRRWARLHHATSHSTHHPGKSVWVMVVIWLKQGQSEIPLGAAILFPLRIPRGRFATVIALFACEEGLLATWRKNWMCVVLCLLKHISYVQLCATRWTIAHHTPLSRILWRQEYWSVLPCPLPGGLPRPGSNLNLLCLLLHCGVGFLLLLSPGKNQITEDKIKQRWKNAENP